MKKLLTGALGAVIGAALAVMLHCSLEVVKIDGSGMLPAFEPDQYVLVWLLEDADSLKAGDAVAYLPPFYETDGGTGPEVRRIESISGEELVLACDAGLTDGKTVTVERKDILGKVLF